MALWDIVQCKVCGEPRHSHWGANHPFEDSLPLPSTVQEDLEALLED